MPLSFFVMFSSTQATSSDSKRGFTLVELMAVVTVVAALASVGLFGVSKWQEEAEKSNIVQDVERVRKVLHAAIALEGGQSGLFYLDPVAYARYLRSPDSNYVGFRGLLKPTTEIVGAGQEIERFSDGVTLMNGHIVSGTAYDRTYVYFFYGNGKRVYSMNNNGVVSWTWR